MPLASVQLCRSRCSESRDGWRGSASTVINWPVYPSCEQGWGQIPSLPCTSMHILENLHQGSLKPLCPRHAPPLPLTPSICDSITLRFDNFRHCRDRAALGPAPIDSACPKTPIPMLVLCGRSLGRPGEAPQWLPRPSRLQPRRPWTLPSVCPSGLLRATRA